MLRPRESIIAKAHSEIMPVYNIDNETKLLFYALLMNTYIGVGDLVMIRKDQVESIFDWFSSPVRKMDEAEAMLLQLGVVITESGVGS